jgi:hypothetical protein
MIMPDTKDGQLMWLNKSTGMRFVRQDVAANDAKKKKGKGKKSSKPKKGITTGDSNIVWAQDGGEKQ